MGGILLRRWSLSEAARGGHRDLHCLRYFATVRGAMFNSLLVEKFSQGVDH